MRDATITTVLVVTETCTGGICRQTTDETVTLSFTGNALWSALGIAAREAGVDIGLLLETYVGAGLSLAGYELEPAVAA